MSYFLTFRARGEVAEMLLLSGESPRLLVDLSTEPLADDRGLRRHTPRASFTITDPELIARFQAECRIGDVAEAEGTLAQGDYIPHRTSHIDTVLTIHSFRRIRRARDSRPEPALATPDFAAARQGAAAATLH